MNLKKMLAGLLLPLFALSLFALDSSVIGGRDGELSRKAFAKACSDEEQMYSIVEVYARGAEIRQFSRLDAGRLGAGDAALLAELTAYIEGKYDVKDQDCYTHIVRKGGLEDGYEGWLVLSNYSASSKDRWSNCIYYFVIAD